MINAAKPKEVLILTSFAKATGKLLRLIFEPIILSKNVHHHKKKKLN